MFAPDHGVTMGRAEALVIGRPWAAADMFRRSLVNHPTPAPAVHY